MFGMTHQIGPPAEICMNDSGDFQKFKDIHQKSEIKMSQWPSLSNI